MILKESHILSFVCQRYGVTEDDLRGPSREQPISWARHVCAWLIRRLILTSTYRSIGEVLGRRHVATMFAVQSVADRMYTDPVRQREVEDLLAELRTIASERPSIDIFEPIPLPPESPNPEEVPYDGKRQAASGDR